MASKRKFTQVRGHWIQEPFPGFESWVQAKLIGQAKRLSSGERPPESQVEPELKASSPALDARGMIEGGGRAWLPTAPSRRLGASLLRKQRKEHERALRKRGE